MGEAYKNFSGNYPKISDNANTCSADFSAGDFYGAGRAANWAALTVLPSPPALGESNNTCGLTQPMIATKDNQKILGAIQTILGDLSTINTMLAGCPNDQADFAPAENWFTYWKGQGEMKVYSTAYKNLSANFATVSAQASALSDAYNAADYFSVGKDAATIAVECLPQQSAEYLQ